MSRVQLCGIVCLTTLGWPFWAVASPPPVPDNAQPTSGTPPIKELLESATQVKFPRKCQTDPSLFATPDARATRAPPRPAGKLAPPTYPPAARQARREGTVTMLMLINEEGRVAHAVVERTSGHTDLDLAALVVTDQWIYTPAQLDGKPHCTWGRFSLEFRQPGIPVIEKTK